MPGLKNNKTCSAGTSAAGTKLNSVIPDTNGIQTHTPFPASTTTFAIASFPETYFHEWSEEEQNLLCWYVRCGYKVEYYSNTNNRWVPDTNPNFHHWDFFRYRLAPIQGSQR